ncbi:MAG: hypothetical protein JW966_12710 [Anaerolineae bacterium]|nr:hypothetical protein [Anaerolineae bacterium]
MIDWLIAFVIGLAVGVVVGIKIARDSNRKEPVMGGVMAHIFHYLACAGLTGMPSFVVAGIIVGLSFLVLFGTAVGFLGATTVFLLLYAVIERSAPPPPETSHLTE